MCISYYSNCHFMFCVTDTFTLKANWSCSGGLWVIWRSCLAEGGGQSLLLFFFRDDHRWAQKQTWTRRAVGWHLRLWARLKPRNCGRLTEEILSFMFLHCWKKGRALPRKKTTIWKLTYASVSAHFTHRAHHETLRCWIFSSLLLFVS